MLPARCYAEHGIDRRQGERVSRPDPPGLRSTPAGRAWIAGSDARARDLARVRARGGSAARSESSVCESESAEVRICFATASSCDTRGSRIRVVDAGAGPPALENSLLAQRGEVLRGAAGVEAELGLQVPDGAFSVGQELEHPDPHGMAEHPEKLGFDDVDGV